MNTSIIDALRSQALERVQLLKQHPAMGELLKIHSAMNGMEDVEGVPRTSLSELFGLEVGGDSNPVLVAPGQYYGKTPIVAAKEFLTRKGRTAMLEEIWEALRVGSCEAVSREKLGLSLARSTFNFVKIGSDLYGLLDWYPDVRDKRMAGMGKKKNATAPAAPSDANSDGALLELPEASEGV